MPRLTEVQRDQAIALLLQGQRQQQVALQFGVNVATIERRVRRLRDNDATSRQGYSSCPPA
jgi:transposase